MIHYHGTPCGNSRVDAAKFLSGRHALIPFPRAEDLPTAAEVCASVVFDNGAFSAWRSGNPIDDWRPYYDWCDKWHQHPAIEWAIIPDVIDGDEDANDELLDEWPSHLDGVPVWHMHESFERLERLSAWPRIALGSSGEFSQPGTEAWWRRMADAMATLCDEDGKPRCKLHGLRMLDPAIFHRLPLSSADSTNAVRNSSAVRFKSYCPPTDAARMSTIADRIEAHQSAAVWVPMDQQKTWSLIG